MMKPRIVAILLTFVFSFSQASALEITLKSKYADALDYLETIDVIEERDGFATMENINKAEFITMLMKNVGVFAEEMQRTIFRTPYADVPLNVWYSPYVYVAYENGLLPEGEYFYPNKTLTRYEALQFFFALEGIPTPYFADNSLKFTDVPDNSKAAAIVAKALELDLITPESDDAFGLLYKMTKGDTALMLYEYAAYQVGLEISVDTTTSSAFDDLPKSAVFLDVWEKIHSDFFLQDEVDDEAMMEAAIEAMVGTLDDSFSVYMPPEEGSDYADSLESELEGIGAYIGVDDGKVVIVSPINGSPAEEAGLMANDQILEIDDEDVTDFSLSEVVRKIRGPKDTQVKIKILRDNIEKTFTITRATVELKSVDFEMQDDIAIITLSQFISRTSQEFDDTVQEVLEENPKGIILDLRNNPGGFLGVAESVLGYFIEKDEVILKIEYPKFILEEKSKGDAELANIPLVVLINGGSASASEIVAGALQDLDLVTIVGETSYGKGTVQELTYYTDDSSLKLTIAKWLTPKGNWVNKTGITPDIRIENEENGETDSQMERALREVR